MAVTVSSLAPDGKSAEPTDGTLQLDPALDACVAALSIGGGDGGAGSRCGL